MKVLREERSQRELKVAEQILDWVESKNLRIVWGRGSTDGAFFPMLDLEGITHYTFAVRTGWKNAHIQLQFAQLLKPFDSLEKRRELADKIQKATGAEFTGSLEKYPGIKLNVLDQRKTQDFLAVFDWYIEQCQAANAT